jgi:hypothetical protein
LEQSKAFREVAVAIRVRVEGITILESWRNNKRVEILSFNGYQFERHVMTPQDRATLQKAINEAPRFISCQN